MKKLYFLLCTLVFGLFSSFANSEECNYAGSNMNYAQTQTEKAIAEKDLNKTKFFTYKAIKTIQNSQDKFDACNCNDAKISVAESLTNLKAATRATSLTGSRILLNEALQYIMDAVDALSQHDMHKNSFSNTKFELSANDNELKSAKPISTKTEIQQRIDASLLMYKESLSTVVDSLDCKAAQKYATRIYEQCEQELLKSTLSEGKKYYYFSTKQITAAALKRIGDCDTTKMTK